MGIRVNTVAMGFGEYRDKEYQALWSKLCYNIRIPC